jgi:pyrophosphatase PpaX
MDGTLVDTTDLIVEGFRETLEDHLGRRLPREEIVALIGRPLREQLREYVAESYIAPLSDRFMTFYEERRGEYEQFFPGALNMLHEARRLKLKTGLVTSKNRREIEGTLDLLRIRELLDFYVSSDDTPLPKPHPDPVLEALRRADAKREQTLFIGDSVYDMQSGADAGVMTGGALWGPFGRSILEPLRPTFLFESPEAAIETFLKLATPRSAQVQSSEFNVQG